MILMPAILLLIRMDVFGWLLSMGLSCITQREAGKERTVLLQKGLLLTEVDLFGLSMEPTVLGEEISFKEIQISVQLGGKRLMERQSLSVGKLLFQVLLIRVGWSG